MKSFTSFIALIAIVMFTTFDLAAQDWANLLHFQKENSTIVMPNENEDRVVFIGNSITQGWIEHHPSFFRQKAYINRGISGQTTPQMLLRFRQDVIHLHPKVVVILAGTNDIAGNTGPSTLEMIEDNIHSMIDLAQSNSIEVVLCSILPAHHFPWNPKCQPAQKIIELNRRLKKYAAENGIVYCDYFSAMADERNGLSTNLSLDGVHPNSNGYDIMEPLVEKAIAHALLRRKKG